MAAKTSLAPLGILSLLVGCAGRPPSHAAQSAAPPAASPVSVSAGSPAAASGAESRGLGQIEFAVSGSKECARHFRDGMSALHSFAYDRAHASFEAALTFDPGCAMAAWGDAMAYVHPIWRERDLAKGRAALARVRDEGLTPKERAFVGVARALYAAEDMKEANAGWLRGAAQMRLEFPDDDEVALQHALALLAVYGYDRAHIAGQMEAGAIALGVLQRRPDHPGAAHYAIHAFDSREHAILALPAARMYARIAPAAGHALHMPSHTFVHLGMWRDVVPSNERAFAASVEWERSPGHTSSTFDWHAHAWLVAALLEVGQYGRAKQVIDEGRAMLVAAKDDTALHRADYADEVAVYVMHTERWKEADDLLLPVFAAMSDESATAESTACAAHAPGGSGAFRLPLALLARLIGNAVRAEAALHMGDFATAKKRVADHKTVRAQVAPWARTLPPGMDATWEAREEMLLARAEATTKGAKVAIDALERGARAASERPGAGPVWLPPARSTLAALLMAAGKPREALTEYERVLDVHTRHAPALLGAARAAKAAADRAKAKTYYAILAEQWRDADPDLPALSEVRTGGQ
jgi:tetratricopeptide (TPR) repeat protein